MSIRALTWTLLAALAIAAVLLFNYWASYQPLSTLAYAGIVLALCGLASLVVPFRFLGVRKRSVGALVLAGGAGLTFAALSWPAQTIRVAQSRSRLDDLMPEYQCSERHTARIHAGREQVMEGLRQSTFGDMKALITLLKIRGAVMRMPFRDSGPFSQDQRIIDSFQMSGYLFDGSEHEIVMFMAVNVREQRRAVVHNAQEFAAYREQDSVKMAFHFHVEDAGEGWSTITAETRVAALGDSRGLARYWRLIVPGSGLLRIQWLEGIKNRAESLPNQRS